MTALAPARPALEEELQACRVLVVEDTEASRRLIGAFLAAAGVRAVEFACDGVEGMEKVQSFDPDLVILDIMMPRMDGFEMCKALRADPRHRRLPVLVQTALGSPEERTSVFRAGATDLVTKPIHGPELIARVRVHLENRLLVRNLERYRERLKTELELAREMQAGLMPGEAVMADIAGRHDLLLQAHFETSSELGGDYWGVRDLGGDRLAVFIVDFAGHGVTAALNTFRLHTIMRQMPPDSDSPAEYLGRLNEILADLVPIDQFATVFFGIVDSRTDRLTYTAAAAPGPVIGNAEVAEMHEAKGVPAGITRSAEYHDRTVAFPPGSFLMLYSDALTETPNGEGLCLDDDDVRRLAGEAARGEAPLEHILSAFRDGRPVPGDDLTVVWLARRS